VNKKLIALAAVVLLVGAAVGYVVLVGGDKVDNSVATEQSLSSPADTQDVSANEQADPATNATGDEAGAVNSTNTMKATKPDSPTSSQASGSYVTYADFNANKSNYSDGKIVYFFNAKWCPTCQALTKDISANSAQIPSGTTIVSVDYDQYTDLKKQYGVTIQHTLVRVDGNGNQIKKWSGSPNLSSVLSQI
jgi:thiol-disulfide isomerase/thioredoxin